MPANQKTRRPFAASPHRKNLDAQIVELFLKRYADRFKFDHDAKRWAEWTGAIWDRQANPAAYQALWDMLDSYNSLCQYVDATTIRSFLDLAKYHPDIAIRDVAWDANPWLLATPTGTIDLQTGLHRPSDPADYLSIASPVTPAETEDCPRWHRFWEEVLPGDPASVRAIKQFSGYALSGDTTLQFLLFLYGSGRNGKGTWTRIMKYLLGAYYLEAPRETFTTGHRGWQPTMRMDYPILRGRRLITADEPDDGTSWAEGTLKAFTGGNDLTGRNPGQIMGTFTPVGKLAAIGNNKPRLKNTTTAMIERLHLLGFLVEILNRDPKLDETLRAEAPGILRWCINGCLDIQANGFIPSPAMNQQKAQYLAEEDYIGQWLGECCELGPLYAVSIRDLKKTWAGWVKENAAGEDVHSDRGVINALTMNPKYSCSRAKDFNHYGEAIRGHGLKGIRLKPSDVSDLPATFRAAQTSLVKA